MARKKNHVSLAFKLSHLVYKLFMFQVLFSVGGKVVAEP